MPITTNPITLIVENAIIRSIGSKFFGLTSVYRNEGVVN